MAYEIPCRCAVVIAIDWYNFMLQLALTIAL